MKENWTLKDDLDCYLYRIKELIKNFFENIKWFWQRGKRGYSDRDLWNLDEYLTDLFISALRYLRKNHYGYPPLITDEEWNGILDKMIAGFVANKVIKNDSLNLNKKEIKLLQGKFKTGMALLSEWYNYLWD